MSTPLALDVQATGCPDGLQRTFAQPFVLIGRAAGASLSLADGRVSRRHAYLQAVQGRLLYIDLGSLTGTLHGGERRPCGRVGQGQPLQIGPFEVRTRWGVAPSPGPNPEPDATPRASGDAIPGRTQQPACLLEISGHGNPTSLWHLRRKIALIGRVASCHGRLQHPEVSSYHCSLVRTPSGLWVVDLLSSGGTFVNGQRVHSARLCEGDAVQAGPFTIRLLSTSSARPRPSSRGNGIFPAPALTKPAPVPGPGDIPVGGTLLQQPPGGGEPVLTTEGDRFQQALVTVLGFFGKMHRDHIEVVREQLEEIRRLVEVLEHQRGDPDRPVEPAGASSRPAQRPDKAIQDLTQDGPAPALGARAAAGPPPREQPDLKEIQAMVTERLAELERDRQGGWKKIVRTLAGL